MKPAALYGGFPRMISRRHIRLVGAFAFLVEYDNAYIFKRSKHRAPRAYDYFRLALPYPLELVRPLSEGEGRMQQRYAVAEAELEALDHLRREGYLGHEHERRFPELQHRVDDPEKNRRLAAPRNSVEQRTRGLSGSYKLHYAVVSGCLLLVQNDGSGVAPFGSVGGRLAHDLDAVDTHNALFFKPLYDRPRTPRHIAELAYRSRRVLFKQLYHSVLFGAELFVYIPRAEAFGQHDVLLARVAHSPRENGLFLDGSLVGKRSRHRPYALFFGSRSLFVGNEQRVDVLLLLGFEEPHVKLGLFCREPAFLGVDSRGTVMHRRLHREPPGDNAPVSVEVGAEGGIFQPPHHAEHFLADKRFAVYHRGYLLHGSRRLAARKGEYQPNVPPAAPSEGDEHPRARFHGARQPIGDDVGILLIEAERSAAHRDLRQQSCGTHGIISL